MQKQKAAATQGRLSASHKKISTMQYPILELLRSLPLKDGTPLQHKFTTDVTNMQIGPKQSIMSKFQPTTSDSTQLMKTRITAHLKAYYVADQTFLMHTANTQVQQVVLFCTQHRPDKLTHAHVSA